MSDKRVLKPSDMAKPRAIQTRYAGYHFRSRLESRWAVFFDAIKQPWEYEKEGYHLPSGMYLPDFWLPRFECWLEVKGKEPTNLERKLCGELAYGLNTPVLLAIGLPGEQLEIFSYQTYGEGHWNHGAHWALDYNYHACICYGKPYRDTIFYRNDRMDEIFYAVKNIDQIKLFLHDKYFNMAKSARFEHK